MESAARRVFGALLKEPQIARKVASSLVQGLKDSERYDDSKRIASFLFEVPRFTTTQLNAIENAAKRNAQVSGAAGGTLPEKLHRLVKQHRRKRK